MRAIEDRLAGKTGVEKASAAVLATGRAADDYNTRPAGPPPPARPSAPQDRNRRRAGSKERPRQPFAAAENAVASFAR
jgi:hypothetical protein